MKWEFGIVASGRNLEEVLNAKTVRLVSKRRASLADAWLFVHETREFISPRKPRKSLNIHRDVVV